jgi:ribonuclease BN (tRNA processing enzyme)
MNPNQVITLLEQQSFDSNRNSILKGIESCLPDVNCDEMYRLLKTYSFDSGRNAAVKILRVHLKMEDENDDFPSLFTTMSYDSGRNEMLRDFVDVLHVHVSHLPDILQSMSYDSSRKEAVKIWSNQPCACLTEANPSDRFQCLDILATHIEDANEFSKLAQKLGFDNETIEREKTRKIQKKLEDDAKPAEITIDGIKIQYIKGTAQTLNIGNKTIKIGADGSVSIVTTGSNGSFSSISSRGGSINIGQGGAWFQ